MKHPVPKVGQKYWATASSHSMALPYSNLRRFTYRQYRICNDPLYMYNNGTGLKIWKIYRLFERGERKA